MKTEAVRSSETWVTNNLLRTIRRSTFWSTLSGSIATGQHRTKLLLTGLILFLVVTFLSQLKQYGGYLRNGQLAVVTDSSPKRPDQL